MTSPTPTDAQQGTPRTDAAMDAISALNGATQATKEKA